MGRVPKIGNGHTKVKFFILLALVITLLFISAIAQYIVPNDPYLQDLSNALQPPSWQFPFGTDQYGRCLLSRVIVGATATIYSSLALVLFISVLGSLIGIFSAYAGGITDTIIMRISDVFLAFPGLVFAIAVAGTLGGGILNAAISLALVAWPRYTRIARGQVLSMKNTSYMHAAKLSGCSWYKTVFKHIMPNVIGPVVVTATLDIGVMIMELAGLSFLGLGATPPTAEWGSMMSKGRSMLQTAPWTILFPGLAILITVMLFNLFGDTVRDMLDPKQKRRSIADGLRKIKNKVKVKGEINI